MVFEVLGPTAWGTAPPAATTLAGTWTQIKTSSIEWYTKGDVKGAMHIRALLIRLVPR